MRLNLKTLIAASTGLVLTVVALTGCPSQNSSEGELLTMVIGTHAQQEDDPFWVDEITGEASMDPDKIRAAETALAIVEEELGVEITWKQYSSDLQQLLLQTVLAGDPYCDLAVLWNGVQGNIMSQNILQKLDPYVDEVFFGENAADTSWIPIGKTFGSYYLMNRDLLFVNTWPLCYNIDYIEDVPALRENGRTVYPSDLYLSGEWTWSTMEDYLTSIRAYYNGRRGPVNSSNYIVPFNTNYAYAALMAIASNGSAVYDGSNMTFDNDNAKEAIDYLDRMINSGLISCSTVSNTSIDSGWLTGSTAFSNGETVFTNVARWQMDNAGQALAERGESMGVIPFPRPDDLPADSDQYRILSAAADSVGLMKGIDAERSERVLEAYATYKSEFYKAYGRVDSIAEYMEEQAATEALAFGVDIFHPEIGDANLEIFREMGVTPVNDYSEAVGVFWTWSDIVGRSIYGFSGTPKYNVAIEANKQTIYDRLDTISEALNQDEVVDDIVPSASTKESLIFAIGTDPSQVDWTEYFSASDNVDGEYELRQENGAVQLRREPNEEIVDENGEPIEYDWLDGMFSVDASGVDFTTSGRYTDSISVTVTDYAGNTNTVEFDAYVYDSTNTVPPTLVLKEEYDSLDLNVDTSTVDWAGHFVETAEDVNGVDISDNVSADVSMLDVTVPGVYPVEIYVTDFAGNRVGVTIDVEIEEAE